MREKGFSQQRGRLNRRKPASVGGHSDEMKRGKACDHLTRRRKKCLTNLTPSHRKNIRKRGREGTFLSSAKGTYENLRPTSCSVVNYGDLPPEGTEGDKFQPERLDERKKERKKRHPHWKEEVKLPYLQMT